MLEEINYTSSLSPRDYAITLRSLSDTILAEQAQTNYWCWKHIQQTEIDYEARYLACVALQLQRGHNANH
jgi:hypothetical protein